MTRLIDELNVLHDRYVELVNIAVADDDYRRADALAAAFDEEAVQLIAEREGKTHLLPIASATRHDSSLRRLARRFAPRHAA